MLTGPGPVSGLARSVLSSTAPALSRGSGRGRPAQAIEERLEREVLEHVSLEPSARVLAELEAVDQATGITTARVGGELAGAIEVEDLGLAPGRDRDQVPEPEADQLEAEVERTRV